MSHPSQQGARVLGHQLQHKSFQWIFRIDFLQDGLVGSPCNPRDSRVFSNTTVQKHQFFSPYPSLWSNSHIHTWLLGKQTSQPNNKNQWFRRNTILPAWLGVWEGWICRINRLVPYKCFPGSSAVKNPPAMQEMQFGSLGREDPLKKGMTAYFSSLAWRSPWTEELGGLQSIGPQRVGHDWCYWVHSIDYKNSQKQLVKNQEQAIFISEMLVSILLIAE